MNRRSRCSVLFWYSKTCLCLFPGLRASNCGNSTVYCQKHQNPQERRTIHQSGRPPRALRGKSQWFCGMGGLTPYVTGISYAFEGSHARCRAGVTVSVDESSKRTYKIVSIFDHFKGQSNLGISQSSRVGGRDPPQKIS